jgi:hypothetical protein
MHPVVGIYRPFAQQNIPIEAGNDDRQHISHADQSRYESYHRAYDGVQLLSTWYLILCSLVFHGYLLSVKCRILPRMM